MLTLVVTAPYIGLGWGVDTDKKEKMDFDGITPFWLISIALHTVLTVWINWSLRRQQFGWINRERWLPWDSDK